MKSRRIMSQLASLRREYAFTRVRDHAAVLVESICHLTDTVPDDELVRTLSLVATTLRYGHLDIAPSNQTRK